MHALAEPAFEATVSPDLVALLSGRVLRRDALQVHPDAPQVDHPVASQDSLFPERVLRRDGDRPITLKALVLYEERVEYAQTGENKARMVRDFRLYITQEKEVVAQVVLEPDNCAARPIHRVERITSVDALAGFVHGLSPDLCFAASPVPSPHRVDFCTRIKPVGVPVTPPAPTLP